jgi:Fe-S-cluster containining protein
LFDLGKASSLSQEISGLPILKKHVQNYTLFLHLVGEQYVHATRKNKARCRRGCHECCTGFFAITLLDAVYLRESLKKYPSDIRKRVIKAAQEQLDFLEQEGTFNRNSPLLRSASKAVALALLSAGMRCPALSDDKSCLIYEHRPFLCRIFGPTVRGKRRAVLLEGCGHFSKDIPETDFPILSLYKDEDILLRSMFSEAGYKRLRHIETIIPAALALDLTKWL